MKLTYGFAFKADAVQSAFLGPLFMNFGYSYLIEGAPIHQSHSHLVELATSSIHIGRHTSIVFYARDTKSLQEVTWAHEGLKPAGHDIPLQCTRCGAIKSFEVRTSKDRPKKGDPTHPIPLLTWATCTTPSCNNRIQWVWGEEWKKPVQIGEGGRWTVRPM